MCLSISTDIVLHCQRIPTVSPSLRLGSTHSSSEHVLQSLLLSEDKPLFQTVFCERSLFTHSMIQPSHMSLERIVIIYICIATSALTISMRVPNFIAEKKKMKWNHENYLRDFEISQSELARRNEAVKSYKWDEPHCIHIQHTHVAHLLSPSDADIICT